jgi:predicted ATPase
MSIESIKIKNLLSFGDIELNKIEDINAIVGMNNVGKSNFLSLVEFFYNKMENNRILAPELNSNYSSTGEITIRYDLSRIKKLLCQFVIKVNSLILFIVLLLKMSEFHFLMYLKGSLKMRKNIMN